LTKNRTETIDRTETTTKQIAYGGHW